MSAPSTRERISEVADMSYEVSSAALVTLSHLMRPSKSSRAALSMTHFNLEPEVAPNLRDAAEQGEVCTTRCSK
eukprot:CAMPEP_0115476032 /NCGR_PEP_ID=MMETSP0271-20121206/54923_1 /TAXON_ID=71861 /ORGANISM="Scrippsiella trochoidea, Strain CCMP3099" /LENGTH=73 /DNA_ID=CAMNT_0002903423 /DNA_START=18 /DNA_END=236 /DNA_ORIENTATION=+